MTAVLYDGDDEDDQSAHALVAGSDSSAGYDKKHSRLLPMATYSSVRSSHDSDEVKVSAALSASRELTEEDLTVDERDVTQVRTTTVCEAHQLFRRCFGLASWHAGKRLVNSYSRPMMARDRGT